MRRRIGAGPQLLGDFVFVHVTIVAPRGPRWDARTSATRRLHRRIGVWPDSIQVTGGTLSFAAAHPVVGVALIWTAASSGTVTRRGSRGDCPARSSTAHLAVPIGSRQDEVSAWQGVIIGVDPHKLSATIEVVDTHERLLGVGSVRHRQGRATPRCALCEGSGRTASGRSREPTVRVVRWPNDWSRPASRWSTCRPSWPPGSGSSTPATTARPTRWTPTRSRSSRSAPRVCGWWPPTVSSRRCGCSPTAATSSPDQRVQTVNRLQRLLSELHPRPAQDGPVRPAGQGDAGHRASPRHRREDPPPDGRRGDRRPGRGRCEAEEDQGRAQGRGHRTRLDVDGHLRHRPRRRGPDPGRRRRHRPVRRPQPVRVLDRHRTPGRLLRASRSGTGCPGPGTGG